MVVLFWNNMSGSESKYEEENLNSFVTDSWTDNYDYLALKLFKSA